MDGQSKNRCTVSYNCSLRLNFCRKESIILTSQGSIFSSPFPARDEVQPSNYPISALTVGYITHNVQYLTRLHGQFPTHAFNITFSTPHQVTSKQSLHSPQEQCNAPEFCHNSHLSPELFKLEDKVQEENKYKEIVLYNTIYFLLFTHTGLSVTFRYLIWKSMLFC